MSKDVFEAMKDKILHNEVMEKSSVTLEMATSLDPRIQLSHSNTTEKLLRLNSWSNVKASPSQKLKTFVQFNPWILSLKKKNSIALCS